MLNITFRLRAGPKMQHERLGRGFGFAITSGGGGSDHLKVGYCDGIEPWSRDYIR